MHKIVIFNQGRDFVGQHKNLIIEEGVRGEEIWSQKPFQHVTYNASQDQIMFLFLCIENHHFHAKKIT